MLSQSRAFLLGLISLLLISLPMSSYAAAVSTLEFSDNQPAMSANAAFSALQQQQVRDTMESMGVDPAAIEQRLAQLSASELAELNAQIEQLPAGAGVAGVVGVVFIVLLILELVGVTNIFTSF